MYHDVILSPVYGIVKKIAIQSHSRIYRSDPLFMIKKEEGGLETILWNRSGEVQSIEVQEGDQVIPGMVLAYIKEELFD
ncbi:hypothetical protein [Heyndrickxia acidicola]|uniref:Lipoyl-binding domain-containing protein n=1 Tax=Heyndrickxia acidicola TaxID=209389 RepID=A0ABU6MNY8_9BACI|nr:hypothetical protein [Heyndrickxia acidicola]MED1205701.1 hypothetical protein [Heyndrickxia acidicola]